MLYSKNAKLISIKQAVAYISIIWGVVGWLISSMGKRNNMKKIFILLLTKSKSYVDNRYKFYKQKNKKLPSR